MSDNVRRRVGLDKCRDGITVSTIEIILKGFHQDGGNFETALISDYGIDVVNRYHTVGEAIRNHEKLVNEHNQFPNSSERAH